MIRLRITVIVPIIISLLSASCTNEISIKSITAVEYVTTSINATNKSLKIKQITKEIFDANGNLIKELSFNDKKEKTGENIYTYDSNQLIKSIVNNETKVFNYDSNNKLIAVEYVDENIIEKYKYDNDLLIQKLEYSSDNEVICKTDFIYDNKNNIIKELIEYNGYKEWYEYEYDNSGNLKLYLWFDSEEGPLEKTLYAYENQNLIKEEWYNYAEGKIEGSVVYHYENSLEKSIIETDFLDNSIIKWEYSYQFDSENNWVKKIEVFENSDVTVTERLLEYK